jgi:hypothetical protein
MQAIRRHQATVAKENTIEYRYYKDKNRKVIEYLPNDMVRLRIGWGPGGKEVTKDVPVNETSTDNGNPGSTFMVGCRVTLKPPKYERRRDG